MCRRPPSATVWATVLSCGSVSEKMIVPPVRSPYPPERVALSFSVVPTTLSGDAEASVTIFGRGLDRRHRLVGPLGVGSGSLAGLLFVSPP